MGQFGNMSAGGQEWLLATPLRDAMGTRTQKPFAESSSVLEVSEGRLGQVWGHPQSSCSMLQDKIRALCGNILKDPLFT